MNKHLKLEQRIRNQRRDRTKSLDEVRRLAGQYLAELNGTKARLKLMMTMLAAITNRSPLGELFIGDSEARDLEGAELRWDRHGDGWLINIIVPPPGPSEAA